MILPLRDWCCSTLRLAGLFNDDQSDEFYMGLLSGLSSALALLQQGAAGYLPLIVAAAAEKVEKREVT